MSTLPNYNPERSARARLIAMFLLGMLSLSLAACTTIPLGLTPEQAVMQGVANSPRPNAFVDRDSVKALQRLEFGGMTFVMVSSRQQADGHFEDCLWLFEARKSPIGGWESGSGGGNCSTQTGGDPAPQQPLDVGGGAQTSSPPDKGVCYTYGVVRQPDIVKVRVTWKDGQVQEVPVVNASYAAIRAGQFNMSRVDGLNEKGESVYQFNQATGPVEKQ